MARDEPHHMIPWSALAGLQEGPRGASSTHKGPSLFPTPQQMLPGVICPFSFVRYSGTSSSRVAKDGLDCLENPMHVSHLVPLHPLPSAGSSALEAARGGRLLRRLSQPAQYVCFTSLEQEGYDAPPCGYWGCPGLCHPRRYRRCCECDRTDRPSIDQMRDHAS